MLSIGRKPGQKIVIIDPDSGNRMVMEVIRASGSYARLTFDGNMTVLREEIAEGKEEEMKHAKT